MQPTEVSPCNKWMCDEDGDRDDEVCKGRSEVSFEETEKFGISELEQRWSGVC